MEKEQALIDNRYLLEKFPGKGGWTFAQIPEIKPDKHAHFGWVRVRGTIDQAEIKGYHMMPMGNGKLFLPVNAKIRKKIGKAEGDYVHVTLYADNLPTELTDELRLCLADEPGAYRAFLSCTAAEQKSYLEWIYAAKTDELKVDRIAKTIDLLLQKIK